MIYAATKELKGEITACYAENKKLLKEMGFKWISSYETEQNATCGQMKIICLIQRYIYINTQRVITASVKGTFCNLWASIGFARIAYSGVAEAGPPALRVKSLFT